MIMVRYLVFVTLFTLCVVDFIKPVNIIRTLDGSHCEYFKLLVALAASSSGET